MAEAKTRTGRGRPHDAAGAQEAIFNAAEQVFAEHGFDGARIDTIAEVAGYNKSLIFQYFGDKLGLYSEVIRRADREMSGLQGQLFRSLADDDITSSVDKFKAFLKSAISAYFDYLAAHPRLMRIISWETAEGWQTYTKIMSAQDVQDVEQVNPLLDKLQRAGLLRSSFNPIGQILMTVFFCNLYFGFVPLLQALLPGEDFSSAAALARAQEFVVEFVVHGMVADSSETKA